MQTLVKTKQNSLSKFLVRLNRQKFLMLMVIPAVVWLLVFCYYPLYGIIIAFKEYNVGKGILGSPWAGLKYFREVFKDPYFFDAFWNTVCIRSYQLGSLISLYIVNKSGISGRRNINIRNVRCSSQDALETSDTGGSTDYAYTDNGNQNKL